MRFTNIAMRTANRVTCVVLVWQLAATLSRLEGQLTPPSGTAFGTGFQPGGQQLFALDLTGTPVGEAPTTLRLLRGNVEVVLLGGARMLKASSVSEFLITLPQVLPQDFTLEFDLVPKTGGPPPDLSIEGTPTINQGVGSAHLLWQADGYLAVIGGAQDNYEQPMPEDLRGTLPGVRTQVGVSFTGPTVKLYTNGRRLFTLDRVFARGRVLRVFLGGVDDVNAVYLAGLRIATGAQLTLTGGGAGGGTGTGGGSGLGAGGGAGTASQQSAMTGATGPTSSGGIQSVGGTPAVVAQPTATAAGTGAASSGSVTTGPVVSAQSAARNSGALPAGPATASSGPPAPPPPPPPASAAPLLAPPVGAGPPPPPRQQQPAATPGSMRLDNVAFDLLLLKGGSSSGGVVETRLADGSIKKQLGAVGVEPLIFDVGLGSPVEAWLQSMLTGAASLKSGSLFGGVVPAQQQLNFLNGLLTSVTIPTLDASSSAPGFLRVSVLPQQTSQTALSATMSTTLPSWLSSDFRLSMGNLETARAMRIESFTIAAPLSTAPVGVQRISTTTVAGQPAISNLLISFAVDAAHPAPNWLAWYDDFVLKGNNDDSHEQSLLLELGVGSTGAQGSHRLALRGYGVGLVALRVLPQPAGSTVQRLQAELYVERIDVVP
jgi:hypothetical protein